jgi:hypothetical protein
MSRTVKPSNLAKAINEEIRRYTVGVEEGIPSVVKEVANEARKELQQNSPQRTGGYAKSWAVKNQRRGFASYAVLYSRAPFYRVAHLLEKGHRKVIPARNIYSGFVAARPHIAPVEQSAIEELRERIERLIREAGQ